MAISASESQPPPPPPTTATSSTHHHHHRRRCSAVVESVECASCLFTEDCTLPYISRVRERHRGLWLCGLCAEAVKDEASAGALNIDEALSRHITFFQAFRSSPPPPDHPISAFSRILRRTLDSPPPQRTPLRSHSSAERRVSEDSSDSPLLRSGSCFSSLSRSK